MKIDAKHLATLDEIKRRGGLTAAARVLGTSQPALSRLVSDLEARLGAPLYDRKVRPWRMTALGETLAAQGRAIQVAQDRATNAVEQFMGGEEGTLRVGGPPYFLDAVVIPLLAGFQDINGKVQFEISYGYTDQLTRRIQRRELDMALCPMDAVVMDRDLQFVPLMKGVNVIACRAGHPLTRLTTPRPLAFLEYGWVVPPTGSPLNHDMRAMLSNLGVENVRVASTGGSFASVVNHLEYSDCLTVMPQSVVFALARRTSIVALPLLDRTPTRNLGILTNADDIRSHLLSTVHDHLQSEIAAIGHRLHAGVDTE